jgi:signal transduction histidine kinase
MRESERMRRPSDGSSSATPSAFASWWKPGSRHAERRLQEELRVEEAAREVEMLARASQSIAHDLRNVFSVVNACAVDLYDEMHGRKAGSLVLEILNAAERGLMATTDLMRAGRAEVIDDRPIDLRMHTSELEPILRRLATPAVAVEMACGGTPVFARIDRTSIMQILMNLVDNATDAMQRKGTIRIECGEGRRVVVNGAPIAVASISVTDSGPGMSPETASMIFDVGFSTKQGPHCGLGLAVVRRVVDRCHGWIDVQSELGKGTTFTVQFPLVEPTNSGIALVVVADDTARSALIESLSQQDFDVLSAADALEACDLMVGRPIADIAVLDSESAMDRGLWHIARLHHVRRTVAVGDDAASELPPRTRAAADALVVACTQPTLVSPIVPPPAKTVPVSP